MTVVVIVVEISAGILNVPVPVYVCLAAFVVGSWVIKIVLIVKLVIGPLFEVVV